MARLQLSFNSNTLFISAVNYTCKNVYKFDHRILTVWQSTGLDETWCQRDKTFYGRNLLIFVKTLLFVPGKPFQASRMFVGKSRRLVKRGTLVRCFT